MFIRGHNGDLSNEYLDKWPLQEDTLHRSQNDEMQRRLSRLNKIPFDWRMTVANTFQDMNFSYDIFLCCFLADEFLLSTTRLMSLYEQNLQRIEQL